MAEGSGKLLPSSDDVRSVSLVHASTCELYTVWCMMDMRLLVLPKSELLSAKKSPSFWDLFANLPKQPTNLVGVRRTFFQVWPPGLDNLKPKKNIIIAKLYLHVYASTYKVFVPSCCTVVTVVTVSKATCTPQKILTKLKVLGDTKW